MWIWRDDYHAVWLHRAFGRPDTPKEGGEQVVRRTPAGDPEDGVKPGISVSASTTSEGVALNSL